MRKGSLVFVEITWELHYQIQLANFLLCYVIDWHIVCTKLGEYQVCFRPHTSTVDNIHILNQTREKCSEYDIVVYNIFAYFNQALYSVNRRAILRNLKDYEVLLKLIQLIKITLTNTVTKVKINKTSLNILKLIQELNKRFLLSIYIWEIRRKLDVKGNISARLKQIRKYAEYVLILGRTLASCGRHIFKIKTRRRKSRPNN
jgi:hypothetical protein